jgi:hypothetical protein
MSQCRPVMLASIFALPVIALTAHQALASKYDFRVYNDSVITIKELYISTSGSDLWGHDVLGSEVLESGENTQILFGDMSANSCLYDIQAKFSNGDILEGYQVNVCRNDWYKFY